MILQPRQRTREVVKHEHTHTHHHTLELKGGDSVSCHEVRKKGEEVLLEGSHRRLSSGRSGSIVTNPHRPSHDSTPPPG